MKPNQTRRRIVTAGIAALALSVSGCSGESDDAASGTQSGTMSSTAATSPSRSASTSKVPRHSSSSKSSGSRSNKTTSPSATGNPLTGGKRTDKPVIAVKLENTAAAMPQSGLSPADLVFVEEVEGSLTRLMPIYQSSYPKRVEPVRSARSTDIDILPMFGKPLLVYSGVAPQVRPRLQRASISLDSNGARDSSRTAPHNMYFNLAAISSRSGLSTSEDIGLRFARSTSGLQTAGKRTAFTVRVGGDRFSFSYNGSRYLPSWNGRPYTDAGAGGRRVTASNVLVLKTRAVSDRYKDPAGNPVYKTMSTGSGNLTLYRNGKVVTGTWKRSGTNKPFTLRESSGRQLHLAPGKSWILLQS